MSLCKIIDYTYITDPCDHWAVNYQWTSTITNQHIKQNILGLKEDEDWGGWKGRRV